MPRRNIGLVAAAAFCSCLALAAGGDEQPTAPAIKATFQEGETQ